MSERKYTLASVGPQLDRCLSRIIRSAGFDLQFEMAEGEAPHPDFENPDISVKFAGRDVDLLLSNRAELLLALEQVCLEALRVPSEDHSRITFDANDYRMLRIEELRLSARAAAERVKRSGKPFAFNPMNSRERRVIHLSLRDEQEIRSESTGVGPHRQVVVYPAGMPSAPASAFQSPRQGGAPRGAGARPDRGRGRPRR